LRLYLIGRGEREAAPLRAPRKKKKANGKLRRGMRVRSARGGVGVFLF
jgi:hypothetical protein